MFLQKFGHQFNSSFAANKMPVFCYRDNDYIIRFVSIIGNLKMNVVEKDDRTYVNLDVWVNSLDLAPFPKES